MQDVPTLSGHISGQSPGSQNWGLKEGIIYPRSNMTEKGKQQLSKTTTQDKSMRLIPCLFKPAAIVLQIAREASRSCAPKNPREESLSRHHSGFSPVLVKTEKSSLGKIHQLYSGVSENVTLTEELCPCLKQ